MIGKGKRKTWINRSAAAVFRLPEYEALAALYRDAKFLWEPARNPMRARTSRPSPLRSAFSDLEELAVLIAQARPVRSDGVALSARPWHLPFWPAGGTSLSFQGIWRARHDGGIVPRGPNGTEPM